MIFDMFLTGNSLNTLAPDQRQLAVVTMSGQDKDGAPNCIFKCFRKVKVAYINICCAFISLILSGLCSLAYTRHWFSPVGRGSFIIIMATTNIIIRLIQTIFLSMHCVHPSGFTITISMEHMQFVTEDRENTSTKKEGPTSSGQTDTADIQHSLEKKSNPGTRPRGLTVNDKADPRVVVLHVFIAATTFGECTFDIVQGAVLMLGMEYDADVDALIVLGTWIGVADETADCVLDIIAFCGTHMKECPGKAVNAYCGFLLIVVLAEQILAITAAAQGLDQYGTRMLAAILPCSIVLLLSIILIIFWFQMVRENPNIEAGAGGSRLPGKKPPMKEAGDEPKAEPEYMSGGIGAGPFVPPEDPPIMMVPQVREDVVYEY